MTDKLFEYIKLHHLSLWQDVEEIERELEEMEDMNSDDYKFKEIEYTSLTGQLIGVGHILRVANEFAEEK